MEINRETSHPEAIRRFDQGEKPTATTNIADELELGYGEMDDYGFFEFPLYRLNETKK